MLSAGPKERFTIAGFFAFGDSGEVGPLSIAAFDLPTAQRIMAGPGLLDAVYVTGEPGVSTAELRREVAGALGRTFEVSTSGQVAADSGEDITEFLDLLTGVLLGFAAIGLVVAAFIIFNTFTILVAQRTHELGLLRAMGASRRQIIVSVVIEAAVIGGVASVAGLALGVLLAGILFSVVGALGFDAPQGDARLRDPHRRRRDRGGHVRHRRRLGVAGVPCRDHPAGGGDQRPACAPDAHVPPAHPRRWSR